MSYIKKISTNIKSPNGASYETELGQYTLLIGANEAGKSAIAESCQLARSGSAYGLLYRDKPIKDGKLLSALVPPGALGCSVTAQLDTGEFCEWDLLTGKRPKRTGPDGSSLSVAELHAVLGGSEESKARYFWEKLCKPLPVADLESFLAPALHEALHLVMPKNREEINLVSLIERTGKLQREQASVVKAGQIALESFGPVEMVSEEELDGVWKTYTRAHYRDIVRDLYRSYKADPSLQSRETLRHLVEMMGGQEALTRIPETEEAGASLAEALLNKRLSRGAIAAKSGEIRASTMKESLKKLKTAILEVMFRMLDSAADFLIEEVSNFLPEGERFVFDVDGKQLKLSIGLEREQEVHTALSGSTEARLLAAIASALSGPDSLIVVDDRMWDATTLGKTLEVLRNAPSQVIVMTTVRPKGKKRSGWNYVEIARTPGQALEIQTT